MGFLVTAVIESLESKFQLSLCRGKRFDLSVKLWRLGRIKEQEVYGNTAKTVYPNQAPSRNNWTRFVGRVFLLFFSFNFSTSGTSAEIKEEAMKYIIAKP